MHYSKNKSAHPLNQFLDGFFNSTIGDFIGNDGMTTSPKVNILDLEKEYLLEMAAPGLKKSDFKISLEENNLTVESDTKNSEEIKKNYKRREFGFSQFKRSFNLPDTVSRDKIDAVYEDGILRITLPKLVEAIKVNKTIEIH